MKKYMQGFFLILMLCTSVAQADDLPDPENFALDGTSLTWDAVPGATGYNIYLDYVYLDTIKGSTQYTVSLPGNYWVIAFDNDGNYGKMFYVSGASPALYEGTAEDVSVTNTYRGTSIVKRTCRDVGPGESCVASCTSAENAQYLSGGACSTSDIVEGDAFVSDMTYKCTVPTFSGEVVAQAICVHW